jgi:hypothetical protein
VKVLRTSVIFQSTDREAALHRYERLFATHPANEFQIPGRQLVASAFAGFSILSGSSEALAPVRDLRATVFVDSLQEIEKQLVETGWTKEGTLGPKGGSLLVRDPDGNLLEFARSPKSGSDPRELSDTQNHPGKERKATKGYSVATLMMRNLDEVFGENDSVRRRAVIDEIWNEDGVFYDPKSGAHQGRDEIDRIAGVIKADHPEFQYQPISKPEVLGNSARVRWVSGRPGEPPSYAGTDFVIAKDGRLSAVYLFFDELP